MTGPTETSRRRPAHLRVGVGQELDQVADTGRRTRVGQQLARLQPGPGPPAPGLAASRLDGASLVEQAGQRLAVLAPQVAEQGPGLGLQAGRWPAR